MKLKKSIRSRPRRLSNKVTGGTTPGEHAQLDVFVPVGPDVNSPEMKQQRISKRSWRGTAPRMK